MNFGQGLQPSLSPRDEPREPDFTVELNDFRNLLEIEDKETGCLMYLTKRDVQILLDALQSEVLKMEQL